MISILFILTALDLGDLTVIKDYKAPGEDVYFGYPYASTFADDGALFLVDRGQSRILYWNADGSFNKAFGTNGRGPGELIEPTALATFGDHVYVWEIIQQISVFDRDGKFVKKIRLQGIEPRELAVLGKDKLLLGFRRTTQVDVRAVFQLHKGTGALDSELFNVTNEAFLTAHEGENEVTIKAYGPEVEIQHNPDGRIFLGFSQDSLLFELNGDGGIVNQKEFDIPSAPPTAEEIEVFKTMSFPLPSGDRISIDKLPGLKVEYKHNKANYTHFMVKGSKIAFILTPLGGTEAIGTGFHRASYYVNDMETGKALSKGSYVLPVESVVHYSNGRAIAYIVDENDDYQMKEVSLSGL